MPKGRIRTESIINRDKKITRLYTSEGVSVKELASRFALSEPRIRQIVSANSTTVKRPRHVWKENLLKLEVGDSYVARNVAYYTNIYLLAKRFGIKVSLSKLDGTQADYEITRVE